MRFLDMPREPGKGVSTGGSHITSYSNPPVAPHVLWFNTGICSEVCALSGSILCSPSRVLRTMGLGSFHCWRLSRGFPGEAFKAWDREAWSCLWVTLRSPDCWAGTLGRGAQQIGAYKALNSIKDDRGKECSTNPIS